MEFLKNFTKGYVKGVTVYYFAYLAVFGLLGLVGNTVKHIKAVK